MVSSSCNWLIPRQWLCCRATCKNWRGPGLTCGAELVREGGECEREFVMVGRGGRVRRMEGRGV